MGETGVLDQDGTWKCVKSDQILETVRETEESRVRLKIFSLSSYMGEAVEELILEGRERVWGRMVE